MEDILQNVKVTGKNETLIEAGKLAGTVGVTVAGAALGVIGGGLDGSAIGNSLANIIFKKIYKVENFCVIHRSPLYKDNEEVARQAEAIIDSMYEKGYFRDILARLRAALEERFDRGRDTAINEDRNIFTDIELAYYYLNAKKIKDKDIRAICTVYYKRKYFCVFAKWGMGLLGNLHKSVKFKVKTMQEPMSCIIL
ncbi:hypothetical protein BJ944DRAFT_284919 [Cunninghamella echinulata]|nr:hypothetical protein BJ944DRAFT_284919 [Cunninghamella echinulata]